MSRGGTGQVVIGSPAVRDECARNLKMSRFGFGFDHFGRSRRLYLVARIPAVNSARVRSGYRERRSVNCRIQLVLLVGNQGADDLLIVVKRILESIMLCLPIGLLGFTRLRLGNDLARLSPAEVVHVDTCVDGNTDVDERTKSGKNS